MVTDGEQAHSTPKVAYGLRVLNGDPPKGNAHG